MDGKIEFLNLYGAFEIWCMRRSREMSSARGSQEYRVGLDLVK